MEGLDNFRSYLSAAIVPLNSCRDKFFIDSIKENLKFSYGNVTYQDYKFYQSNHDGSNRQELYARKLQAIPRALYSGLVQTTCHLFMALFQGVCCIDSRLLRLNVFRFARDVEESFGWILTIFHDKIGSYLVEESLFQKECYSIFERGLRPASKERFNCSSGSSINGMEEPVYHQSRTTTLQQFQEMGDSDRAIAIEIFGLRASINGLGDETFFQKLKEANPQALSLVTLKDLRDYSGFDTVAVERINQKIFGSTSTPSEASIMERAAKTSPIPYVLLSDVEFSHLTLNDIREISSQQIKIVKARIKFQQRQTVEFSYELQSEYIVGIPIAKFYAMSGKEINQIIDKIPAKALRLLNDDQIRGLDLSLTSLEQIEELLRFINIETTIAFLHLIPSHHLTSILPKLPIDLLKQIPNEKLSEIDITGSTNSCLAHLFSGCDEAQKKARLACIPARQLTSILPKLPIDLLKHIPNERLSEIDVTGLTEDSHFLCLFSGYSYLEATARLNYISISQLTDKRYELVYLNKLKNK